MATPSPLQVLLASPLGRLRAIAFVEGWSYLLLLGVAMPLKYMAGMPSAVRVLGSIHGLLFVLFCMALLQALTHTPLGFGRACVVFASSLVPFGTFAIDGRLKRWGAEAPATAAQG